MKEVICEKGHKYDASKYSSCPYCGVDIEDFELNINPTASVKALIKKNETDASFQNNGYEKDSSNKPIKENIAIIRKSEGMDNSNLEKNIGRTVGIDSPNAENIEKTVGIDGCKVENIGETVPIETNLSEIEEGATLIPEIDLPIKQHPLDNKETYTNMDDINPTVAMLTNFTQGKDELNHNPLVGWLVCLNNKYQGKDYKLFSGRNKIGRNRDNDISILDDHAISRYHTEIIYDPYDNIFHILSGSSRGLTYVNSQLVLDNNKLVSGNRIRIGNSEYIFISLCNDNFRW